MYIVYTCTVIADITTIMFLQEGLIHYNIEKVYPPGSKFAVLHSKYVNDTMYVITPFAHAYTSTCTQTKNAFQRVR